MTAFGGSPQDSGGPNSLGPNAIEPHAVRRSNLGGTPSGAPLQAGSPMPGLIGDSPAMHEVYRVTRRVAASNASVLILGETGVGKEMIAAAVHRLSRRGTGPFVRVNCGALSESLLESELFGHVRGAYTGAVGNRTGRFEAAHTGTIFLDEINSTSLVLQVKLLRVLQEREFERVGDTQTISVDTRVIAASNRDLMGEVESDRFREDLYWRLNVVPIEIPPLRERREDIPALVSHFLDHYNEANDRYVVHIQREAMTAMQDYHWPGNVRELQNYIERAVVMADGDEFTIDLLPETVSGVVRASQAQNPVHNQRLQDIDLDSLTREVVSQGIAQTRDDDQIGLHGRIVESVERELFIQVLRSCGGVRTQAATKLGINRNTLHKKIKDYGLDNESDEQEKSAN
jgi:DNA-binding NtrC family response regulator